VNVALPANIAPGDLAAVVNDAGLVSIACAADELAALAPALHACRALRTLIIMDGLDSPCPQLPSLTRQARSLHEVAGGLHGARARMLPPIRLPGNAQ